MPRLAATPDEIRATVLAMLTGAGVAAPLSRTLNAIEAEVVRAGLADLALPEIPVEIAEQMRALWQTAVAVQLDDVVRLKREAQSAAEAVQAARAEAELRVELLRQELSEVRQLLAARDTELAEARAALATMTTRADQLVSRAGQLEAALASAQERATTGECTHAEAVATIQAHEALSKQLLQETAHQRDAVQAERAQLASQLKFAERRIATLEQDRGRLDADLASERAARQSAAGEVSALKAVTATQHAQLDELLRATLAAAPGHLSEATCTRALAVVASCYRYWYDTGYLHANPAAGLSAGSRARAGFAPTRLIPPALLAACDAWLNTPEPDVANNLTAQRRRAIRALDALRLRQGAQAQGHSAAGPMRSGAARLPMRPRPAGRAAGARGAAGDPRQ